MRIKGVIILSYLLQLLQRCLDGHIFLNKIPKSININKLDTFLVDCMTDTSLYVIDSVVTNGLIRDNPATIDFLTRTSNEIDIRPAKTLPDLIFYISSSL